MKVEAAPVQNDSGVAEQRKMARSISVVSQDRVPIRGRWQEDNSPPSSLNSRFSVAGCYMNQLALDLIFGCMHFP